MIDAHIRLSEEQVDLARAAAGLPADASLAALVRYSLARLARQPKSAALSAAWPRKGGK